MMKASARRAAAQIGQGAAGEEGGPGHGEAPEAVDHPCFEILGQGKSGGHAADQHSLEEDPRHDEVDVIDPWNVDGPSEHVAEEQQDDRGLHDRNEQQLGRPDNPQEIPPGDAADVAHGQARRERHGGRVGQR